jgi:hypothetical protein
MRGRCTGKYTGLPHSTLLFMAHRWVGRMWPVVWIVRCAVPLGRLLRRYGRIARAGELRRLACDLTGMRDPALLLLAPHVDRRVYRMRRSGLRLTDPLVDLLRRHHRYAVRRKLRRLTGDLTIVYARESLLRVGGGWIRRM